MTKRTAAGIRGVLHVFLGITSTILVTGGGRLHKVDFISVDAWVAVALAAALALHYAGEPLFYASALRIRDRIAERPFVFVGALFAILFFAHLARFLTLGVDLFDAGFLYQAIFNAFHGPFLKCDVCFSESYLGAHSAFTLALLTPFAKMIGSPFGIPFLQALIGFACFAGLARAFRDELGAKLLAFSFFALLSIRGIRESFVFDFREDLIGAAFFVLAFAALKAGRPILALIPFVLAALSKETAAILLPFAMMAGLYQQGRPTRLLTLTYVVFGISVAALISFVLLPRLTPSGGSGSDIVKRLAYLGATPVEIMTNLAVHPLRSAFDILSRMATIDRMKYLLYVAGPVTLIASRAFNRYYLPGYLLIFGNLLSEAATQRMMQFHYEILLIPFFGFGICETLRRLKTEHRFPRNWTSLISLAAFALSGVWPLSHLREYLAGTDRVADVRWARGELALIPPEGIVLGDSRTFPLLTDHPNLRLRGGAKSGMSTLDVGDARFAILRRENALMDASWIETGCGPRKILCRYEKH